VKAGEQIVSGDSDQDPFATATEQFDDLPF